MYQHGLTLGDLVGVEDVDVRLEARLERTAVLESEYPCRSRGHAADTLAEAVDPGFADPIGQGEGRPAGVHDLRDVRARIAQAREDVVALEEIAQLLEVLVEHAQVEQCPAVGLVRQTEEGFHPVLAVGLRQRFQVVLRRCRVVGRLAIAQVEHVGHREAPLHVQAFVDEVLAGLRIADRRQSRFEVLLAHLGPGLALDRQVRLQAEHEAGTPHLGDGRQVAVLRKLLQAGRALGTHALLRPGAVAE